MDRLSDDELALVLRRIGSKVDRKACAQVCKQWLRVEGATRRSLRILDPAFLRSFLPRFPFLTALEVGRGLCNADLVFIARTCPSLQTLNLSITKSRDLIDFNFSDEYEVYTFGSDGVNAIASSCRNLQQVSLRFRHGVEDRCVSSLTRFCSSITHLDLSGCDKITDCSLEHISMASSLQVLLVQGCKLISDAGIRFMALGKPSLTLTHLDLSDCSLLSDEGVALLPKMTLLQRLHLARCSNITDASSTPLASMQFLHTLDLSWIPNISDSTIVAIGTNCTRLRELVLCGCDVFVAMSLQGFSNLESLTLFGCRNVLSEDVEAIALSCHSLKYLGLDKDLRRFIPESVLKNVESRCNIEWR